VYASHSDGLHNIVKPNIWHFVSQSCCWYAGLGGELREVGRIEQRVLEAAKLGFTTFVIPASHTTPSSSRLTDMRIIRCKHIMEALKAVLGTGQSRASLTAPQDKDAFQDPFDDDDDSSF